MESVRYSTRSVKEFERKRHGMESFAKRRPFSTSAQTDTLTTSVWAPNSLTNFLQFTQPSLTRRLGFDATFSV